MVKTYNLENLTEFSYNPFLNYKPDKIFNKSFIHDLLKTAKPPIIKHVVVKKTFTEKKFLFSVRSGQW